MAKNLENTSFSFFVKIGLQMMYGDILDKNKPF